MTKPLPPFLTPFEFIRVVTNALGLTKQSKYLDDRAHNLTADYRDIKQAIFEFIQNPLWSYLDKERASIIADCFALVFTEYLELLSKTDLSGVTREKNCVILAEHFLPGKLLGCIQILQQRMPGPDPMALFGSNCSAIATVISWAETNLPGWTRYYSGLSGDKNANKRNRINKWKSGDELPTLAYIIGLQGWSEGPWPEFLDWSHLKAWLLIGRAIDWAQKTDYGQLLIDEVRSQLWGATPLKTYVEASNEAQELASKHLSPCFPLVAIIQNELKRTSDKKGLEPRELLENIEKLRGLLADSSIGSTTTYWADWHEARWHVFNGDLKTSVNLYKKAFEGCIYRAGKDQNSILNEARAVASSLSKPDAVFLKKLRNSAVMLGVDAVSSSNDISKTSFESWEVNAWRTDFKILFPSDCFFDGVVLDLPEAFVGPLIFDLENKPKLDTRYPNKKTKIGEAGTKGIQQLTLAIHQKDFESTNKLIESGATVNCLSDSNESPLLMALEMANRYDHPSDNQDERFFKLISQQPHDVAIVNQVTKKVKHLPLIVAVKSGNSEIVQKLIEMGADVNLRGETDNQTALNICLKVISAVKQPEQHWSIQMAQGLSDEVLEAARRHSNGALGSSIEQVKANIVRLKNDRLFGECFKTASSMAKVRSEKFDLDELRKIAVILIKAGADSNAEHRSPLMGFTPLMLATELDEVSLVEKMLKHGGQPDKTYYDRKAKFSPDCWHIAYFHRAIKVCHLLNRIRHEFRKPELPLEGA